MLRVISPLITPLVSIIGLTFVGTKILIGGFLFSAEEKQKWRMMYNGVFSIIRTGRCWQRIFLLPPYIDDQDMAELMKQTVLLLEEMSEEDFSELVFVPAEEEDEPEWEGLI